MIIQGSEEWLKQRSGHASASRFKDLLATIKTGEAASRRNYRAQLVCERLTGLVSESYMSAEMKWGKEQEPYARMAYEAQTGFLVEETEFLKHPSILWCGASPDGIISKEGGLEIKCPNMATHLDTLFNGMPSEHIAQIQGGLWITGREWWDFVSFDPRMPEPLRFYVQRIVRDEAYITNLEKEVKKFLNEVDEMLKKISNLNVTQLKKAA